MSRQAYAEAVTYTDEISGSLKAANAAEVSVFLAGTETLAKLYEARSGGALVTNPFVLGSTAMAYFWADTGDYDIKVHDTKGPARFGDYVFGWQSSPANALIGPESLSNSGDIEWTQDLSGAWIPQLKTNAVGSNEILNESVGPLELSAASKPFDWYTPKVIATEEARGGVASFATLATADEIPNVVVPANGFVRVYYRAKVKTGSGVTGKASIFVGSNQVKNVIGGELVPAVYEATAFEQLSTIGSGLVRNSTAVADATTGQIIADGSLDLFLAAGTYTISVQYFGTITAKERKLFVAVLGV